MRAVFLSNSHRISTRPFTRIYPPVYSHLPPFPLAKSIAYEALNLNLRELELYAVDNFRRFGRSRRGATVLAPGKGWVLAMLPMLPAKWRVRVGPRGSGPGAKRRRPCPPLRAAAAGWRRDEGRPDPSTPGLRPGSNKGLTGGPGGKRRPPAHPPRVLLRRCRFGLAVVIASSRSACAGALAT